MRKSRIAAVALILGLSAGAAQAIEVHKTATVKGTPEDVWAKIGAFCAIQEWHPVIASCEESEEGGDKYRALTTGDGAVVKEKLIEMTASGYTYEIVESPLPVANYRATLSVAASGDGTVVDWVANFDAKGASDADAEGVIAGIFQGGLDNIVSMMGM
jgi:hypothetical protein